MDTEIKNLHKHIEDAKTILIVSHISPDLDAYCSSLLTYGFISSNWSDKKVYVNIQGSNSNTVSFLRNSEKLTNQNTLELLKKINPDLFIMVDANNFLHFSGPYGAEVREYIYKNNIQPAIIDHHQEQYKEEKVDLYINRKSSSASEEVYRLFVHDYSIPPFEGAPETAMYGILADTNRFMYANPNHRETFSIVSELLDTGIVIEELWNKVFNLKLSYAPVFAELLNNLHTEGDYNYSYISVEFAKEYVKNGGTWDDFSDAYYLWGDLYIRYFGDNTWGYILAPDFSNGIDSVSSFRGSFRALKDIDTSMFARALGGGGHKLASGFSVNASIHKEAIDTVTKVIKETR